MGEGGGEGGPRLISDAEIGISPETCRESSLSPQDRSWIDHGSIQDRSMIDPGSILDRSGIDPAAIGWIRDVSQAKYRFRRRKSGPYPTSREKK